MGRLGFQLPLRRVVLRDHGRIDLYSLPFASWDMVGVYLWATALDRRQILQYPAMSDALRLRIGIAFWAVQDVLAL